MAGALEILMANGRRANTAGSATVSPVSGLTFSGKLLGPMRPSGRGTAVGGAGVMVGSELVLSLVAMTGGGGKVGVAPVD